MRFAYCMSLTDYLPRSGTDAIASDAYPLNGGPLTAHDSMVSFR
jgi:hypothetical protein